MWPFQEIARTSEAFEQSLEAFPETALAPAASIEEVGEENTAYGAIAAGALIGLVGFAFMKKRGSS